MFDVKHEWQKSVMKLMQIILEKSCRKNLKIKISDERKERNAHVKKKIGQKMRGRNSWSCEGSRSCCATKPKGLAKQWISCNSLAIKKRKDSDGVLIRTNYFCL